MDSLDNLSPSTSEKTGAWQMERVEGGDDWYWQPPPAGKVFGKQFVVQFHAHQLRGC